MIKAYCHIRNWELSLNGESIQTFEEQDFDAMLKSIYKKHNFDYSKFYKMDALSKLGFACAEVLLQSIDIPEEEKEHTALVFANSESTIHTDSKFYKSIEEDDAFFPSPAVFVYTLPNIVVGEICIRHKLKGENAFFIFESFNADRLQSYVDNLLKNTKTRYCLAGWVEYDELGNYDAFIYLIGPNDKAAIATVSAKAVENLYKN